VLDVVSVESLSASGSADVPDAVVTTTPELLAQLLFTRADLDAALETGLIRLEGDREALERYLGCFGLPESAPATSKT
jgi:hypothetical protein